MTAHEIDFSYGDISGNSAMSDDHTVLTVAPPGTSRRQLAGAGDVAKAREQADRYVHAAFNAFSRASALSGSAVAPSIHTSPPSKYSCFQIGTICLIRSIA